MISAVVDRSVVEQFREQMADEIERAKDILVDRTSDRQAGKVQGMRDAVAILNNIIQQQNDQRSSAANPQR